MLNKIVTRGLGSARTLTQSSGLVVQGYGPTVPGFIPVTIESVLRPRPGQSGTKRRLDQLDEVIIWAKLIEVNGRPPRVDVRGTVKVRVDSRRSPISVVTEHISTRTRGAWETIKVTARRIRRG